MSRAALTLTLARDTGQESGFTRLTTGERVRLSATDFSRVTNLLAAATMHRDRKHVQGLIDRVFTWFPRLAQRATAQRSAAHHLLGEEDRGVHGGLDQGRSAGGGGSAASHFA